MSADDGPRSSDDYRPSDGERRRRSRSDGGDGERTESMGLLRRFATATDGPLLILRETTLSVGAVVVIGLLLFAISGVWPPMVAVESGSMEPHMHKGDLVFITDAGRFVPDAAREGTGVVTRDVGREVGYWKFGGYGSVIVYDNPGDAGPPVIHRAQFWVDEGENWYDEADSEYVSASSCAEMMNCPAPHAGFVTKGDANAQYDQVNGISEPVKPEWIVGIARVRIPYLGWVRLGVSGVVLDTTAVTGPSPTIDATVEVVTAERPVAVTDLAPTANDGISATADGGVSATTDGGVSATADGGVSATTRAVASAGS